MKKNRIILFPILGLLLSGCTSPIDTVKNMFFPNEETPIEEQEEQKDTETEQRTEEEQENEQEKEEIPGEQVPVDPPVSQDPIAFSFEQIPYKLKDGVDQSEIQGAPWINSNIEGIISKIEKPSVKDDFYTSVNYDRIINGDKGLFDKAEESLEHTVNLICDESSNIGNSSLFSRAKNMLYDGNCTEIHNYFSKFNIDTFMSSKELFSYASSFFQIEKTKNNSYHIYFTDGYVYGDTNIATLSLDYTASNLKNQLIKKSYNVFDLVISNSEINNINNFDTNTCSTIYNTSYNGGDTWVKFNYGIESTSLLDAAILDLNLPSNSSIYISSATRNVLSIIKNTNKTTLTNALVSRLLFEMRFLCGCENYKSYSKLIGDCVWFPLEKDVSKKEDNKVLCVMLKNVFKIAFERAYLEVSGNAENKARIAELIERVKNGYKETAKTYEWLDETTRKGLIDKLDYMGYRSCYSEIIKNYPLINEEEINEDNLLNIYKRYGSWLHDMRMNGALESDYLWTYVPSFTINAYYSPGDNSFIILNGLLGGINMSESDEELLATMGVIIGHEISHSIDATGAQYDKNGRLSNWWSSSSRSEFNNKVEKLIDFYNKITIFNKTKVNGNNVQGEAIADMGGVHICLEIAKTIENFDYDLFFKSYAYMWQESSYKTDELSKRAEDEHPFEYLRVNATLSQFEEFFETYDIKNGDRMYTQPEQRVAIW